MGKTRIETKICPDCKKEIRMEMDEKDEFIHYEKMCPCITEIMRLREKRSSDFKNRKRTVRDEMRGALFVK